MPNYYCEYCGVQASSIISLTSASCFKNPNGGKHKLYEGTEKNMYYCKYCGISTGSILQLTSSSCFKHPNGNLKGKHAPAL
ncbi:hypothetical protein K5I29_01995 [Flavobacterium agricola]|uniref:Uncharacterized protein n=1 Tax=Flavobacterium agricola TaxID=2870839 RepID=A0ABY6M2R4_9FLAO|nr:hypothetical protein [Flavobacterium agricola]UYW01720.1 hypothetical protein K5I29_01995 [Flavobacterium agricola]